jgi:hypothetical protein
VKKEEKEHILLVTLFIFAPLGDVKYSKGSIKMWKKQLLIID